MLTDFLLSLGVHYKFVFLFVQILGYLWRSSNKKSMMGKLQAIYCTLNNSIQLKYYIAKLKLYSFIPQLSVELYIHPVM